MLKSVTGDVRRAGWCGVPLLPAASGGTAWQTWPVATKSDFTEEEWRLVVGAPAEAGMMIALAQRGGTFRETIAMSKAYAAARTGHGASELLDAVVSSRPKVDHPDRSSPEALRRQTLGRLKDAVSLLQVKATPQEVEDYVGFIIGMTRLVAEAHEEDGAKIGQAEQEALDAVAAALRDPADPPATAE